MIISLLLILLIWIAWIDFKSYHIPDWLVLSIIVLAAIYRLPHDSDLFLTGGIGSFCVFCSFYYLSYWWYKKEAFGFGDVKLLSALGLFWGPVGVFYVAYVAIMLAGIVALIILLTNAKRKPAYLPFAPFITASTIIYSIYITVYAIA